MRFPCGVCVVIYEGIKSEIPTFMYEEYVLEKTLVKREDPVKLHRFGRVERMLNEGCKYLFSNYAYTK